MRGRCAAQDSAALGALLDPESRPRHSDRICECVGIRLSVEMACIEGKKPKLHSLLSSLWMVCVCVCMRDSNISLDHPLQRVYHLQVCLASCAEVTERAPSQPTLYVCLHIGYIHITLQVCLAGGLEVNECQGEDHGCWAHGNTTACVDTFRGYLCVCPEGAPTEREETTHPPFSPLVIVKGRHPAAASRVAAKLLAWNETLVLCNTASQQETSLFSSQG